MVDIEPARIGVIGGSGLYVMEDLTDRKEVKLTTPFGDPSAAYVLGNLDGKRVAFLARHGAGHHLQPSELNYRANIFGFKMLGVEWLVSASAVGSLQEGYRPLDIVVPDQFLDRTRGRSSTFFGNGVVAHITFAHPICSTMSRIASDSVESVGKKVHRGGTYVCIEGPQFSTLAESRLYRDWQMDVIGMTNLQEAKLAREAEICYATLALVTDYDCWHPDHDQVTVDAIIKVLLGNADNARALVKDVVPKLHARTKTCNQGCQTSLDNAVITSPDARDPNMIKALGSVAGRVLTL